MSSLDKTNGKYFDHANMSPIWPVLLRSNDVTWAIALSPSRTAPDRNQFYV